MKNQEYSCLGYQIKDALDVLEEVERQVGKEGVHALIDGRAEIRVKPYLTEPRDITLPTSIKPLHLRDCPEVQLLGGRSGTDKLFYSTGTPPSVEEHKITYHDLNKKTTDIELSKQFVDGTPGVFRTIEELDVVIAQLATKQYGGEECLVKEMIRNNIFYVRDPRDSDELLSICCTWSGSQWSISRDRTFAGIVRNVGDRIFLLNQPLSQVA